MSWLPLAWTLAIVGLVGWFMFTVEGEDTMAIPIVWMAGAAAIFGGWVIYALWYVIAWLF